MSSEGKKFSRNINITQREYQNNLQPGQSDKLAGLKKAGEAFYNLILDLDLFGQPITLRFNGKDKFKSLIGATISLSVIGLIFIYISYSLIIFLGRGAPTYSSIIQTKTVPQEINFSKFPVPMDWTIGVDIFDEQMSGSVMDPSIFKIDVKKFSMNINVDPVNPDPLRTFDFPRVPCTSSEAFSQINGGLVTNISEVSSNTTFYNTFIMADKLGKETAHCFLLDKMNDTANNIEIPTTLIGTVTSDVFEYIGITINVCKSGGEILCKSIEEIKQSLKKKFKVRFYFTHQVFKAQDDLTNMVQNSTTFYQFPIQSFFSKSYSILTQSNTVMDSWNLFSTKMTSQTIFSHSPNHNLEILFVEDGVDVNIKLLEIDIVLDQTSNTYIRKFQNINDFFIRIMGILNGLFAVGMGIGQFLNAMLFKVDLINRTFYVIENDDIGGTGRNSPESKKRDGRNIEMSEMKDEIKSFEKTNRVLIRDYKEVVLHRVNTKNSKSENFENKNNLPQQYEIYEDIEKNSILKDKGSIPNIYYNESTLVLPEKSKKFKKFKMNFLELILKLLPCCKSKNLIVKSKIFESCGSIIESFLDIERIVGILREYQDLRNVVLSPEEYTILKQLTTPKVEVDGDEILIKKVDKLLITDKQLKASYNQFVHSINKMIRMPYLTSIENNLLEIHKSTLKGGSISK